MAYTLIQFALFFPAVTVLDMSNFLELIEILNGVSGLWYPLGLELQFTEKMLKAIGVLADQDVSTCVPILLLRWLMRKDPPPTLEKLAAAVSSIGKKRLAQLLRQDKDRFNQQQKQYNSMY